MDERVVGAARSHEKNIIVVYLTYGQHSGQRCIDTDMRRTCPLVDEKTTAQKRSPRYEVSTLSVDEVNDHRVLNIAETFTGCILRGPVLPFENEAAKQSLHE